MWSELPNYNPVGISTSEQGQDFGGGAKQLFFNGGASGTPTIDDEDTGTGSPTWDIEGDGIEPEVTDEVCPFIVT